MPGLFARFGSIARDLLQTANKENLTTKHTDCTAVGFFMFAHQATIWGEPDYLL